MTNSVSDAFIFTPALSAGHPPVVTQVLGMWAAVFRQGVIDYAETMRYENGVAQGRQGCLAEDRAAVKAWFASDAVFPGSFVWLCHIFGQDAGATRRFMRENWRTLHLPQTRARKKEVEDDELEEFA